MEEPVNYSVVSVTEPGRAHGYLGEDAVRIGCGA